MAQNDNHGGNLGFEAELFKAADKLRGNMEPSDYKHVALGLIFLKYISDAFEARHAQLLAEDDSIANYINGLALQKYPPKSESEFLPVIKIAQLRAGNTDGADKASTQLKPEYIVEDGDVLFSWSGSLEVEVWTGGRGALNQHLFKVTSQEVPKWFFYFATRLHLPDFRAIAAGKATTMGHIQRKHLTAAKIAVPPQEVMKKFDACISPLFEQETKNAIQSKTLGKLRDTLLPKLISGELQANDAERFMETVDD